jgi:tetratricopeptide (TPR) repeat protein
LLTKKLQAMTNTYLNHLRYLADCMQFEEVCALANTYYHDTADVNALPLLSFAHVQLGQRKEAVPFCELAEKSIHQLDFDARIDLAGAYNVMLRLEDAKCILEPAIQAKPEHALALGRLAWCYLHLHELDKALRLYIASSQFDERRIPVWTALVRLYLQTEQFTEAQSSLEQAIQQIESQQTELSAKALDFFTAELRALQLEIWVACDARAEADTWLDERFDDLEEAVWVALAIAYATRLAHKAEHADAEDVLRRALKRCPDNMELLSHFAQLAELQGRMKQSEAMLRKMMKLARKQGKPEVPILLRMANAKLQRDATAARKHAKQAQAKLDGIEVSEDMPQRSIDQLAVQLKQLFAQIESQEQNYSVAEELFNELLLDNPYFLPALQGLGQQQLQRGNIDEAVALFERVKEVAPERGYSALITARQFPTDEAVLKQMELGARRPSLDGPVRSGLLLQAATAWEKLKNYDKAYALAKESNDAAKKLLPYDPVAHRTRCARIRTVFTKALYRNRPDYGSNSTVPVYVVGMPRSGTTLVEQILASHSQIFGAGELGLISSATHGLSRFERQQGSGRAYPDVVDDLTPYVTQGIAEGIVKELKELASHDKPEALHVVDKLPHNFEHVGFIKFLFPRAKIISVRRDPRDIAMSNFFTDYQAKRGGMGFAYDMEWIGQQLADHNLLMHHWQQVFPGEILEINYEDVVEDTEGMARKMLDYIGVEFEPQVLAFNELDRPVKTASVWQVRQPIYKTSKAKWMRYQDHLGDLVKGTNAKITWEFDKDVVTLPTPGMFEAGVGHLKEKRFRQAEEQFQKVLHHLPEHAAAKFLLGSTYVQTGYTEQGIPLMEQGYESCKWNKNWRKDLIRAYRLTGDTEKAEALMPKRRKVKRKPSPDANKAVRAATNESDPNFEAVKH